MKSFLFVFVFFLGLFVVASDADFDYASGTCNICGAGIGWHYICPPPKGCGHVMCDNLEPACKVCAYGTSDYSGTFDPSVLDDYPGNTGGDDGGDDPADNPMISSKTSSGGVTTTIYTDGSISISGSDGGSGTFDLKPGSDLSVTFYQNGSKVVSGTDSDGNSFTFTVLSDGSSFNGTNSAFLDSPVLGSNTTSVPGDDSGDSDNPYFGDGNDPFVSPDNPDPDNPDLPDPEPDPDPDNPDPDNPDPGNPDPDNPDPDNPNPDNPDPDTPDPDNPDSVGNKVEVTNWPVTKYSYLPGKPDLMDSIGTDSSFLDTFCRKFLPCLPSVSGSNDISIPLDFDLSGFPVNLGRLSFVIGGFHSVLDGALVPVMAFCRSFSIFLFVFFFCLSVVRALRQW